jgi:hypothetical protein
MDTDKGIVSRQAWGSPNSELGNSSETFIPALSHLRLSASAVSNEMDAASGCLGHTACITSKQG